MQVEQQIPNKNQDFVTLLAVGAVIIRRIVGQRCGFYELCLSYAISTLVDVYS
jgi:hypothetical protein